MSFYLTQEAFHIDSAIIESESDNYTMHIIYDPFSRNKRLKVLKQL
jgi:hypothetical protein